MNTKKFLLLGLAIVMMASLAVPAFAAETNTHELIYQNDASYEISIPATSNIDIATGKGTIDIGVTDANLEDWTKVVITASSSNYADDTWNLVNTKNSNDKIAYTIGTTDGSDDISSGDRVVDTETVGETTLYVTVSDISKVGTFTDMITFTSEITIDLIDFSIVVNSDTVKETLNFSIPEGMTWEDWVNSSYSKTQSEDYKFIINDDAINVRYLPANNYNLGYVAIDISTWADSNDVISEGEYGLLYSLYL